MDPVNFIVVYYYLGLVILIGFCAFNYLVALKDYLSKKD